MYFVQLHNAATTFKSTLILEDGLIVFFFHFYDWDWNWCGSPRLCYVSRDTPSLTWYFRPVTFLPRCRHPPMTFLSILLLSSQFSVMDFLSLLLPSMQSSPSGSCVLAYLSFILFCLLSSPLPPASLCPALIILSFVFFRLSGLQEKLRSPGRKLTSIQTSRTNHMRACPLRGGRRVVIHAKLSLLISKTSIMYGMGWRNLS